MADPRGLTPPPVIPAEIPMTEQEAAAVYEGLVLLQAFLGKGGPRRRRASIYSERQIVNVQDRITQTYRRLGAYYRPNRPPMGQARR